MIELRLQSMLDVEPEAFDFLLTDPPYSAWVHQNTVSSSRVDGTLFVRAKAYEYGSLGEFELNRTALWCALTRGWSLVCTDTGSRERWFQAFAQAKAHWRRDLLWKRWSSPVPGNVKPPHVFELVMTTFPAELGVGWYGPGSWLGFDALALRGAHKLGGEKPLDLALEAVLLFSEPGQRGVDLFGGMATFACAAWYLDRDFRSYEVNPDTYALSVQRLERLQRQEPTPGEFTRLVRFVTKYPQTAPQISAKLPAGMLEKALRRNAEAEARQQRKAVRKLLVDDATGPREYEALIKGIYT